ncbi:MAG: hypothetical protein IPP88_15620 [Betaproteobacteria bacterium]|nr:hypothetical protein [Betaproteobacteria bacterium]
MKVAAAFLTRGISLLAKRGDVALLAIRAVVGFFSFAVRNIDHGPFDCRLIAFLRVLTDFIGSRLSDFSIVQRVEWRWKLGRIAFQPKTSNYQCIRIINWRNRTDPAHSILKAYRA